MDSEQERAYLRTVAELQELARNAPYVDQDWVLQVASMDPADMRRRLIRSNDWHGHFAHSLDGIPAIQNLGGAGIDGCRSHKEVRAVVLGLLDNIERLEAARRTPSHAVAPAGVVEALREAIDALESIALAGMSGTGQESDEGMRAWHSRRAWEFIGIAARALDPARAALATAAQPGEDAHKLRIVIDLLRDYLEAQDNLDNWEFQSINRDDYFVILKRRNIARDSLDAALSAAPHPAAPAGYVLVPVEPTDNQVRACMGNEAGGLVTPDYRRAIYRAMLSAAPTPPQPAAQHTVKQSLTDAAQPEERDVDEAVALAQAESDRETGEKWRRDSSLETWFPLTAERLAELEAATQPAQPGEEAWRPIESAPKDSPALLDGPVILLGYAPDEDYPDGYVAQGRWHDEDHDGPDNMGHDAGFMDDRFEFFQCARSFGNPKYQSKGVQPTHWRPLPPPPTAARAAQAQGAK